MRQVEDQNRGVLDGICEGGVGVQVVRERNIGKVFDVLMEVINEVGKLLGLGAKVGGRIVALGVFGYGDGLFVDPHLNVWLEDIGMLLAVLGDDFGNGRPPEEKGTSQL